MAIEVSYSQARQQLASLLSRAVDDREEVVIRRRGRPSVALVAADEWSSMKETAYLLRSPENARRILEGLKRARTRKGQPQSVESLRREFGLEK